MMFLTSANLYFLILGFNTMAALQETNWYNEGLIYLNLLFNECC
jgi:hypothetical protein